MWNKLTPNLDLRQDLAHGCDHRCQSHGSKSKSNLNPPLDEEEHESLEAVVEALAEYVMQRIERKGGLGGISKGAAGKVKDGDEQEGHSVENGSDVEGVDEDVFIPPHHGMLQIFPFGWF